MDWSVRKLSRTGSSIWALVQICEWQFMHVLVGGMPAKEEFSTEVWQYRQSMPKPPTWCSWLNGTGCWMGTLARVAYVEAFSSAHAQTRKATMKIPPKILKRERVFVL